VSRVCGHEDGEDRSIVACGVEILEIKSVVPSLVVVSAVVSAFPNLELDRDDCRAADHYDVDS